MKTRPIPMSDILRLRSIRICKYNGCVKDGHNCDSFAYLDRDLNLLDICTPDYFSGSDKPYAAIYLPFWGTEEELQELVTDQIEEQENN